MQPSRRSTAPRTLAAALSAGLVAAACAAEPGDDSGSASGDAGSKAVPMTSGGASAVTSGGGAGAGGASVTPPAGGASGSTSTPAAVEPPAASGGSGGAGIASAGSDAPTADAGMDPDTTPGTLDTSCDDAADFDARVTLEGGTWVVEREGAMIHDGADMLDAIQAALDSLSPGRTTQESVIVCGSGSVGPHEYDSTGDLKTVDVPGYSVLDVRGTITVADTNEGDIVPIRCRNQRAVSIPNVRIEGNPRYALWFQSCHDVELGHIEVSLSNVLTIGLGVRIDDSGNGRSTNVSLDYAFVETTGDQGVETYGVDGLRIGRVDARNTAGCGLLLNDTSDAEVGLVDSIGAGSGTGYAAFRIANAAGPDIHVGKVLARGGGRGVFCVTESHGLTIDEVDIEGTESNGILLENCHDIAIATQSGRVSGADVRIAARAELPPSSNIAIQNLTVEDGAIRESPCDGTGNQVLDNTLVGSSLETCAGTLVQGNTP